MIKVNNKWKLEVDTHNNHQPFEYREVENHKEKTKEFKWMPSGHFFCNVGLALSYIINCELREGLEENTVDIKKHLDRYEAISLELNNNQTKSK